MSCTDLPLITVIGVENNAEPAEFCYCVTAPPMLRTAAGTKPQHELREARPTAVSPFPPDEQVDAHSEVVTTVDLPYLRGGRTACDHWYGSSCCCSHCRRWHWRQETRRQISGTLRDADAVVPGTTVRIKNLETKVTQNLVTNVASPQRGPEKSGRSRSPRSGLSSRFMNSPG